MKPIFAEQVFFKAKNTHFGKLRNPGPPPFLGIIPKIYNFFYSILNIENHHEQPMINTEIIQMDN